MLRHALHEYVMDIHQNNWIDQGRFTPTTRHPWKQWGCVITGIMLGMVSANDRRRHCVTSTLIVRAHNRPDPRMIHITFGTHSISMWQSQLNNPEVYELMILMNPEGKIIIKPQQSQLLDWRIEWTPVWLEFISTYIVQSKMCAIGR